MTLIHFDIPAKDVEKIKQFYQEVFGWRFERKEGNSENWSVDFKAGEQQRRITGRILLRSAPSQPIGCHFLVSSVAEAAETIKNLGGIMFVPKTAVPGEGYYACCLDPENNYFVIWEDDKAAG